MPAELIGRAMADVQRMSGEFEPPVQQSDMAVLTGSVPAIHMREYQTELISYTKGRGRLFCTLKGYFPCHNEEEVVARAGYDSERDTENPTGSVFCAHGAGFVVKWNEVQEYMHLENILNPKKEETKEEQIYTSAAVRRASVVSALSPEEEAELERMAEASRQKREQARKKYSYRKAFSAEMRNEKNVSADAANLHSYKKKKNSRKEYLLVDGYNIIFAWEGLRELAEVNIDGARGRLMDILSDYQGVKRCFLILVFDAYRWRDFRERCRNTIIFMWSIRKRQRRQISISKRWLMRLAVNMM